MHGAPVAKSVRGAKALLINKQPSNSQEPDRAQGINQADEAEEAESVISVVFVWFVITDQTKEKD